MSFAGRSGVRPTAPHVSDGASCRPWGNPQEAVALRFEGQLPFTRLRRYSHGLSSGASKGKSSLSFGTYLWCPLVTGSGAPACSLATASPVESSHPHDITSSTHNSIILLRCHNASWIARMKMSSTTRALMDPDIANGRSQSGENLPRRVDKGGPLA